MPNQKNTQIVETLKDKVARAKSIILTDYIGLKATDISELRQQMRDENAEVAIAKNTLIKVALKENKIENADLENDLAGPTAVIFSYNDPISPIKKLFEFAKKLELPKIKSALVDGQYNNAAKVQILSELPSREELITRVLGGLQSPVRGFVNVLGGTHRKFLYVLSAIADKREGV